MNSKYLSDAGLTIEAARRTDTPRYGMTALGYTVKRGGPTSLMIRLAGETRWRRLMVWQFSNWGTCFVRIKGVPHIVHGFDIPEVE